MRDKLYETLANSAESLPSWLESRRVIKKIHPAAQIVAEMMSEGEHIIREEFSR